MWNSYKLDIIVPDLQLQRVSRIKVILLIQGQTISKRRTQVLLCATAPPPCNLSTYPPPPHHGVYTASQRCLSKERRCTFISQIGLQLVYLQLSEAIVVGTFAYGFSG